METTIRSLDNVSDLSKCMLLDVVQIKEGSLAVIFGKDESTYKFLVRNKPEKITYREVLRNQITVERKRIVLDRPLNVLSYSPNGDLRSRSFFKVYDAILRRAGI